MIYFTADEHHGHYNIIKYCKRPFKTLNGMEKTIVANHNAVVKKDDLVYHVGDFSIKSAESANYIERILAKLNGMHILILGNHDALKPFKYIDIGFQSVHTSLDLGFAILAHDPSVSQIDRSRLFLCGHVHDLFLSAKNAINVGIDMHGFEPLSIVDISKIVKETQNADMYDQFFSDIRRLNLACVPAADKTMENLKGREDS